jgi:hypothetical protein
MRFINRIVKGKIKDTTRIRRYYSVLPDSGAGISMCQDPCPAAWLWRWFVLGVQPRPTIL